MTEAQSQRRPDVTAEQVLTDVAAALEAAQGIKTLMETRDAAQERIDALQTQEAALRARFSALQGQMDQATSHAEQMRALQREFQAVLTEAREAAGRDLDARREELRQATTQAEGTREALLKARGELAEVEGTRAASKAALADLEARRRNLEAEIRLTEDRRAESLRAMEEAQHQLAAITARVEEAAGLEAAIRNRVDALAATEEALRQSHRPLLPYSPPLRRPRLATAEQQLNVKVQAHDAAAVRVYAEQSGLELKRVATEALRNYLPHEAYAAALEALEEQAREELESEEVADIRRVPPEGAAARRE